MNELRRETLGHKEEHLPRLVTDLKRKIVEPIALAEGAAFRTLHKFQAFSACDHERGGRTRVLR